MNSPFLQSNANQLAYKWSHCIVELHYPERNEPRIISANMMNPKVMGNDW
ncbi:hypothetical protein TUM3794_26140 [Shewanella colwelliana]|uniref:Uncharacterized protein n=1 Tax=Shewanella colwelliana TaxID=23 RepID=A0ABQ4P4U5_SHECO|nr:hypothetical protein TUM3794_26140 [Shewanella colwelliana]